MLGALLAGGFWLVKVSPTGWWFWGWGFVITSYSIHYTKLYESIARPNCGPIFFEPVISISFMIAAFFSGVSSSAKPEYVV